MARYCPRTVQPQPLAIVLKNVGRCSALYSVALRRVARRRLMLFCTAKPPPSARRALNRNEVPGLSAFWRRTKTVASDWSDDRQQKRLLSLVHDINALEGGMRGKCDAELQAMTGMLKAQVSQGSTLDELLPCAYAVVREAARRVLGQRMYDVQLFGSIVLHEGKVAEMATGEGKTLVATPAAYLNALGGQGVHILTVNMYLAKRDAEWVGKVLSWLGLSVGVLTYDAGSSSGVISAQEQAACDVVYTTAQDLGFTALDDFQAVNRDDVILLRPLHYAIIDEVDSILVDEGVTPLVRSVPFGLPEGLHIIANRVAQRLKKGKAGKDRKGQEDYFVLDKEHIALSSLGEANAQKIFDEEAEKHKEANQDSSDIPKFSGRMWSGDRPWGPFLINALKAREFHTKNVDYVVINDEIKLLDASTGRMQPLKKLQAGLQEAVEAKEGLAIAATTKRVACITYQCFFNYYPKLAGMTGTAISVAGLLQDTYGLQVVPIPRNRPVIRIDMPHRLYRNTEEKIRDIFVVMNRASLGLGDKVVGKGKWSPMLLGTSTLAESKEISQVLMGAKIPHQLLNADPDNAQRESRIIAQAGLPGMITIATNMAGRGTDILLGGNPKGLTLMALESMLLHTKKNSSEDDLMSAAASPVTSSLLQSISSLESFWARPGVPHKMKMHAERARVFIKGKLFSDEKVLQRVIEEAVELAERLRAEYLLRSRFDDTFRHMADAEEADTLEVEDTVDYDNLDTFLATRSGLYDNKLGDFGDMGALRGNLVKCAVFLWLWLDGQCKFMGQQVREEGGLFVIGTSLQESERVETQLRGRAGRQGDPGRSWIVYDLYDRQLQALGMPAEQMEALWSMRGTRYTDSDVSGKQFNAASFWCGKVYAACRGRMYSRLTSVLRDDESLDVYRSSWYNLRRLLLWGSDQAVTAVVYSLIQYHVVHSVYCNVDTRVPPDDEEGWQWANIHDALKDMMYKQVLLEEDDQLPIFDRSLQLKMLEEVDCGDEDHADGVQPTHSNASAKDTVQKQYGGPYGSPRSSGASGDDSRTAGAEVLESTSQVAGRGQQSEEDDGLGVVQNGVGNGAGDGDGASGSDGRQGRHSEDGKDDTRQGCNDGAGAEMDACGAHVTSSAAAGNGNWDRWHQHKLSSSSSSAAAATSPSPSSPASSTSGMQPPSSSLQSQSPPELTEVQMTGAAPAVSRSPLSSSSSPLESASGSASSIPQSPLESSTPENRRPTPLQQTSLSSSSLSSSSSSPSSWSPSSSSSSSSPSSSSRLPTPSHHASSSRSSAPPSHRTLSPRSSTASRATSRNHTFAQPAVMFGEPTEHIVSALLHDSPLPRFTTFDQTERQLAFMLNLGSLRAGTLMPALLPHPQRPPGRYHQPAQRLSDQMCLQSLLAYHNLRYLVKRMLKSADGDKVVTEFAANDYVSRKITTALLKLMNNLWADFLEDQGDLQNAAGIRQFGAGRYGDELRIELSYRFETMQRNFQEMAAPTIFSALWDEHASLAQFRTWNENSRAGESGGLKISEIVAMSGEWEQSECAAQGAAEGGFPSCWFGVEKDVTHGRDEENGNAGNGRDDGRDVTLDDIVPASNGRPPRRAVPLDRV